MIPCATYRIQFRNGMTFDRVVELVPYLKDLGSAISMPHRYLPPPPVQPTVMTSPILTKSILPLAGAPVSTA